MYQKIEIPGREGGASSANEQPLQHTKGVTRGDCANCPFAIDGKPPHSPVLAQTPRQAPHGHGVPLLVGEIPSKEDVANGRPFSGHEAAKLDAELRAAGLERAQCVTIYGAACRMENMHGEAPIRRAVLACQSLFWAQLAHLPPDTPVLAMGRWAHFALTGKHKKVLASRGFVRQEYRLVPPNEAQAEDTEAESGSGEFE